MARRRVARAARRRRQSRQRTRPAPVATASTGGAAAALVATDARRPSPGSAKRTADARRLADRSHDHDTSARDRRRPRPLRPGAARGRRLGVQRGLGRFLQRPRRRGQRRRTRVLGPRLGRPPPAGRAAPLGGAVRRAFSGDRRRRSLPCRSSAPTRPRLQRRSACPGPRRSRCSSLASWPFPSPAIVTSSSPHPPCVRRCRARFVTEHRPAGADPRHSTRSTETGSARPVERTPATATPCAAI